MTGWLRRSLCRLVCPHCDRGEHERARLDRAADLHAKSVLAVEAASLKQARRLSDVRVVVDATIRQMKERAESAEEQPR